MAPVCPPLNLELATPVRAPSRAEPAPTGGWRCGLDREATKAPFVGAGSTRDGVGMPATESGMCIVCGGPIAGRARSHRGLAVRPGSGGHRRFSCGNEISKPDRIPQGIVAQARDQLGAQWICQDVSSGSLQIFIPAQCSIVKAGLPERSTALRLTVDRLG